MQRTRSPRPLRRTGTRPLKPFGKEKEKAACGRVCISVTARRGGTARPVLSYRTYSMNLRKQASKNKARCLATCNGPAGRTVTRSYERKTTEKKKHFRLAIRLKNRTRPPVGVANFASMPGTPTLLCARG